MVLGVWIKENISCSLVISEKEVVSQQSQYGWHWVKGKNNANTHICHCSSIWFVLIFIVFDHIVWCDSLYKIIYIFQLKILLYLRRVIPLFVDLWTRKERNRINRNIFLMWEMTILNIVAIRTLLYNICQRIGWVSLVKSV